MDKLFNGMFIILFLGFFVVVFKILLDSNLDRFFKQGKVGSIRVAYFILSLAISFLVAFGLKELSVAFYNIFS